ncbi:MAG: hypothetical protein A2289_19555 [Deltaproteobacteria bacterium RIFOXYA12_FULL_58_15]|nr:MAG: hypothetical protein A2289_19555 [Deltaproteobacteria bacterium RIFOXYA12_FULL_58_15]OGR15153.1 MAG: hypothetical protein A2341_21465 [Deltaproteobacteria bacterium RIFOXYB12_FULL_58_9]
MRLLRVAIIGPESTGKTTLARDLANAYGTTWVHEYSREYLEGLGRPYEERDLAEIARGQIAAEKETTKTADRILFADTNLWVIKIWSEVKYGRCDPFIEEQLHAHRYDLTLLTAADLPWVPDPLRELPDDAARRDLFATYHRCLQEAGVVPSVVRGTGSSRLQSALEAVAKLLDANPCDGE